MSTYTRKCVNFFQDESKSLFFAGHGTNDLNLLFTRVYMSTLVPRGTKNAPFCVLEIVFELGFRAGKCFSRKIAKSSESRDLSPLLSTISLSRRAVGQERDKVEG